jgi:colanic acid/amylovoran biosynthesis glycosyltransferase
MLANRSSIERRISQMKSAKRIRLLFSGRLDLMKGVNDLPILADHLRDLKVPFEMSICGEGEFADKLKDQIHARRLDELVTMEGTLEFKSKLVPFLKEQADLFVCCHRQGDPSCTYLETMSCGVPIVGYANEAFSSLATYSGVGWTTPVGDPLLLAKCIESIHKDRDKLSMSAHRSMEFASQHTFEKTFSKRIQHLDSIAESYFPPQTR